MEKLNSFNVLWILVRVICVNKIALSNCKFTSRKELIISGIENQVKALRSDVNLLQFDSAEFRMKINELNETSYLENELCGEIKEKHDRNRTSERTNATTTNRESHDLDLTVRLMKAFRDEKLYYRGKMNEFTNSKHELLSKIQEFQKENIDLDQRWKDDTEKLKADIAKNENDMAGIKTKLQMATGNINTLESDDVSLNKSIEENERNRNTEIDEIKEQMNKLSSLTRTLETGFNRLQDMINENTVQTNFLKECDGPWIINNELKSCFLFISKKRTWNEAVEFCRAKGARLVEISNARTHAQVKRMFEEIGYNWGDDKWDGFWAGGSLKGEWIWEESNMSFDWSNWYPGEPGTIQRHLAVMVNDKSFRWDDQDNWINKPFICEKIIAEN